MLLHIVRFIVIQCKQLDVKQLPLCYLQIKNDPQHLTALFST